VHWRYALTDVLYRIANIDPVTNWGDWADEYYTIYPDGIAIRHFLVHGEEDDYSITEPTLFSNPGQKPEDNIELAAVTLANLKGQISTHSYEQWPADEHRGFKDAIDDPVVAMLNLKSKTKAFYIYEQETHVGPYGGGIREIDYRLSNFHWRNHWPVSQIPCDGRFVLANDRVTSSAIISAEPFLTRRKKDRSWEGRFILGITDKTVDQLIPFARFYLNPPILNIENDDFVYQGFNKNDRAYHISKKEAQAVNLKFSVKASQQSPLVNPVFVIENWGNLQPVIKINNHSNTDNIVLKYDLQKTLGSGNLIIWLEIKTDQNTNFLISPKTE
jgi:hypothetical protein